MTQPKFPSISPHMRLSLPIKKFPVLRHNIFLPFRFSFSLSCRTSSNSSEPQWSSTLKLLMRSWRAMVRMIKLNWEKVKRKVKMKNCSNHASIWCEERKRNDERKCRFFGISERRMIGREKQRGLGWMQERAGEREREKIKRTFCLRACKKRNWEMMIWEDWNTWKVNGTRKKKRSKTLFDFKKEKKRSMINWEIEKVVEFDLIFVEVEAAVKVF